MISPKTTSPLHDYIFAQLNVQDVVGAFRMEQDIRFSNHGKDRRSDYKDNHMLYSTHLNSQINST